MKVRIGQGIRFDLNDWKEARDMFATTPVPKPETPPARRRAQDERVVDHEARDRHIARKRAPKSHALYEAVLDAQAECSWWTPEGKRRALRLDDLAFHLGLLCERGYEITGEEEAALRVSLKEVIGA